MPTESKPLKRVFDRVMRSKAFNICFAAGVLPSEMNKKTCHLSSSRCSTHSAKLRCFPSLCLGLGREYFRYPSQGTFFKPARTDMMSRTLSANSIGVSPGFKVWGSKYQTSQTTAQDVISCSRCIVKDCFLLFQKASTKILLYLIAIGQTVHPSSNAPFLNMTV